MREGGHVADFGNEHDPVPRRGGTHVGQRRATMHDNRQADVLCLGVPIERDGDLKEGWSSGLLSQLLFGTRSCRYRGHDQRRRVVHSADNDRRSSRKRWNDTVLLTTCGGSDSHKGMCMVRGFVRGCNHTRNSVVRLLLPMLMRFVMGVAVQNRHSRNGHACDERNQNSHETTNDEAEHLSNVTDGVARPQDYRVARRSRAVGHDIASHDAWRYGRRALEDQ